MKDSDSPVAYRAILPHRDTKRQPEQDIAKGIGMVFVLFLHGPIMRIFCDIFGITGSPAGSVGLVNVVVFLLTLLVTIFFIYLKGLINHKKA